MASLPARGTDRVRNGPGNRTVRGCLRRWVSTGARLCRQHSEQRQALGVGLASFLANPRTRPLKACEPCSVAACTGQRRHRDGVYCETHQIRLRTARFSQPALDEHRWQATGPAFGRGGEISLRGLPPLLVAEVLVPPRSGEVCVSADDR